MAAGTKSDFEIYHEEFFGGLVESLQQNVDAFNAASNGAIRMATDLKKGDYERESFFLKIASLVTRRDVTSVAAAADTAFPQAEFVGVKINRKIGPIAQTVDSFRKVQIPPSEFSFLLGQQTGPDMAGDFLNTGLLAVEGALDAQTALEVDATDGTLETPDLVTGLSKLGDMASRIRLWVMHSKVFYDLVKDQIADNILDVTGGVIKGGIPATLGRPVLVTDSAALVESGTVTQYVTLGLVEGAIEIAESEERQIASDLITGLENLVMRIQGEFAYNIRLKGFQWDIANGGANPTDTAVGTGTNWDKIATSTKDMAGVHIRSD